MLYLCTPQDPGGRTSSTQSPSHRLSPQPLCSHSGIREDSGSLGTRHGSGCKRCASGSSWRPAEQPPGHPRACGAAPVPALEADGGAHAPTPVPDTGAEGPLQQTCRSHGRSQTHRVHTSTLGAGPQDAASGRPRLCAAGPPGRCRGPCCARPVRPHLAPGRAQCVNSINKQQMEKYISREHGGVPTRSPAAPPALPPPALSSPPPGGLLFGSAAPQAAPWPEGPVLCPRGPHPPPTATCARGPRPWQPPRWWPCAPRVPGRPRRSPWPPWELSRWCCPQATPGPRSAGWGPGRAG